MKRTKLTLLIVFLIMMADCSRVPITGRRQFDLVPDQQILSMSQEQYSQFLGQARLSNDQQSVSMVQNTGRNIAGAVEQFLREQDMEDEIENFEWEFNLVDDPSVNAWAMPGGKVVFYTGILPIAESENGVAVVMGHEIAHAVAKHGNERLSQSLATQLGGVALSVALRERPQETQNLFLAAYGVGTAVGVTLPFSRRQESEADRLGSIFMAMAGYDPRESIAFWQRMNTVSRGPSQPEFLSTHPSHARRIQDLEKCMPEAMEYYQRQASAN